MTSSQPQRAGFSPQRLARVDRLLERYVHGGYLAGALALIYRRGEVAHFNAIGQREVESGRPMTEDTIFRIYSMTKPVTSVAALMLYEDGHFLLDDPLSLYMPEFEEMGVYSGDLDNLVKPNRPITVKDLFMHTSGLSYGWGVGEPVEGLYRQALGDYGSLSLENLVQNLATLPLLFHPGECWHYGYATDVLGRLIELLSGQSLDCFLFQEILKPLGMTDTAFSVPAASMDRFAACYGPVGGFDFGDEFPPIPRPEFGPTHDPASISEPRFELEDAPSSSTYAKPPLFLSGGGGLVSTVDDYLRFAKMLLNDGILDGNRLLGRKTVEMIRTNHLPPELIPIEVGGGADPGCGFGLGVRVMVDLPASNALGILGIYGWSGAALTDFWIDPLEEMIGLLMAQYLPIDHYLISREFRLATYQALES